MSISIKTESELNLLREVGKIHKKLIEEVTEYTKANYQKEISTYDIELKTRELCREYKVIPAQIGYRGYKYATCVGLNDDAEHCIPKTTKIVKTGDLITIDTVIKKLGFHADGGLTLELGKSTLENTKLLSTARDALKTAINMCVTGNYVYDISNAMADMIESNGYHGLFNFAAHGIGREMHEDPDILNIHQSGKSEKLQAGMVLALDTMITKGSGKVIFLNDGWSTKTKEGNNFAFFEYTVIVGKIKPEIINEFPLE